MKKAVFFDIDGTLFQTGHGIPDSTKKALKMLKDNGHYIFISTGRAMGNIDDNFQNLGMDGYVAGAGTYVRLRDKILTNVLMSPSELERIRTILDTQNVAIIYEGDEGIYYDKNYLKFISYLSTAYSDTWPITKFQIYESGNRVNKLCCEAPKTLSSEFLIENFGEDYSLIIHNPFTYFELMPKGCDKASGIYRIIDELDDVCYDDIVAFGDSNNDIGMLKAAKLGIAMGNSCDDLKNVADFVTKDILDDGIYYALKNYGLI